MPQGDKALPLQLPLPGPAGRHGHVPNQSTAVSSGQRPESQGPRSSLEGRRGNAFHLRCHQEKCSRPAGCRLLRRRRDAAGGVRRCGLARGHRADHDRRPGPPPRRARPQQPRRPPPPQPPPRRPRPEVWDLVYISDSLGSGGVPAAYAALIERDLGVTVEVHDMWTGGLTARQHPREAPRQGRRLPDLVRLGAPEPAGADPCGRGDRRRRQPGGVGVGRPSVGLELRHLPGGRPGVRGDDRGLRTRDLGPVRGRPRSDLR